MKKRKETWTVDWSKMRRGPIKEFDREVKRSLKKRARRTKKS